MMKKLAWSPPPFGRIRLDAKLTRIVNSPDGINADFSGALSYLEGLLTDDGYELTD